jgi:TIR domain
LTVNVFISHAYTENQVAERVADELKERGLGVLIDREQVRQGDRFLRFMEEGLSKSDYCLLLWSRAAASGKWVTVEWEAALYRAVQESRRFLLVGRLDLEPLPALLRPRLHVNLFPRLYPGLDDLFAIWTEDAVAVASSGRPIRNGTVRLPEDTNGATIYLTSELFGLTQPVKVDMTAPAGLLLDRVVSGLELPRRLDHQGVMGVEFVYRLVCGDIHLTRGQSLIHQGVREFDVLWLEVEIAPFAAGHPVSGDLSAATYRNGTGSDTAAPRKALLAAIEAAGFGMPDTVRP